MPIPVVIQVRICAVAPATVAMFLGRSKIAEPIMALTQIATSPAKLN